MSVPGERHQDPDADLVAAARAGKAGAFERLFQRYWRVVMKLSLSHIADVMEAEDAAIETFEGVARGLARFRAEARFSTWLYRVALNRISHHRRKSRNEPTMVPVVETDAVTPALEDERDLRLELAAVLADIRRLPTQQAQALTLRHLVGLELAEVAAVLGVSNATAGMRIARAAAALRRMQQARLRPG
jgi:RNA polymerase sigma-70 factor (ECF subfamily)